MRMRSSPRAALAGALASLVLGCAPQQQPPADSPSATMRDTSTAAGEWRPLFDGRSLAGWRGFRKDAPPAGWEAKDGLLQRTGGGGDLMTVDQFENFELEAEWRVGPAGNSGIFYRVVEQGDETYHSGIEMQVLDDAGHADGGNPLTSAGALYGLYPAPRGIVKPAGEWNAARIVVRGNHVEHWLNGTKVVDAELWSPDFTERHRKSKFVEWPPYAKATRGHIALQDHGDPVAYRNIRIRVLP